MFCVAYAPTYIYPTPDVGRGLFQGPNMSTEAITSQAVKVDIIAEWAADRFPFKFKYFAGTFADTLISLQILARKYNWITVNKLLLGSVALVAVSLAAQAHAADVLPVKAVPMWRRGVGPVSILVRTLAAPWARPTFPTPSALRYSVTRSGRPVFSAAFRLATIGRHRDRPGCSALRPTLVC